LLTYLIVLAGSAIKGTAPKKFKNLPHPLFRFRTNHTCHQIQIHFLSIVIF
jgi:hypothetical protein